MKNNLYLLKLSVLNYDLYQFYEILPTLSALYKLYDLLWY